MDDSRPADVLGQILDRSRLTGQIYCRTVARAPWGLRFPARPEVALHLCVVLPSATNRRKRSSPTRERVGLRVFPGERQVVAGAFFSRREWLRDVAAS